MVSLVSERPKSLIWDTYTIPQESNYVNALLNPTVYTNNNKETKKSPTHKICQFSPKSSMIDSGIDSIRFLALQSKTRKRAQRC